MDFKARGGCKEKRRKPPGGGKAEAKSGRWAGT